MQTTVSISFFRDPPAGGWQSYSLTRRFQPTRRQKKRRAAEPELLAESFGIHEDMNLEIKNIYSPDIEKLPNDPHNFAVLITVDIGEKDKEGAETFHFVAVSPRNLQDQANGAHGFRFLRGYILLNEFAWSTIHRAIQNLVNHAQSRSNWHEVISFFNRYGTYSSEDLDGRHYP